MIYAAPSATVEVPFDNAPTGLVGTLGVRVVDGQGATTIARSTAGIVESPAGSGIYTATITAPSTEGQYSVVADTGGGTPLYARRSLTVSYSARAGASPSGSDLTTVARVREFLQKPDGDSDQDDVIQTLIASASAVIMREFPLEFAPATPAATRAFHYHGGGVLDLAPYVLRAATLVQIDTDGSTTPQTLLATTDYSLHPMPSRNGVFEWMRLPRIGLSGLPLRQVSITGSWGFASVPEDVQHWATVTVGIWLRRDVQAFSTAFNLDEGRVERPQALPAAARAGLSHYARIPVA